MREYEKLRYKRVRKEKVIRIEENWSKKIKKMETNEFIYKRKKNRQFSELGKRTMSQVICLVENNKLIN